MCESISVHRRIGIRVLDDRLDLRSRSLLFYFFFVSSVRVLDSPSFDWSRLRNWLRNWHGNDVCQDSFTLGVHHGLQSFLLARKRVCYFRFLTLQEFIF